MEAAATRSETSLPSGWTFLSTIKNLIHMAAQEIGISNEAAENINETSLGKFLSSYVTSLGDYTAFMSGESVEPLSDQMYRVQTELVKKLAARSSCVIVGRCADYILGDYSNCIHVFIHAFKEDRVRRISRIYKLNEKQAWDKIKRTDRERRMYYETHAGRPGEALSPTRSSLTPAFWEWMGSWMRWRRSIGPGRSNT